MNKSLFFFIILLLKLHIGISINYLQLDKPTTIRFYSNYSSHITIDNWNYRESHTNKLSHSNLILDLHTGVHQYDNNIDILPIHNKVYHFDNRMLKDIYISPYSKYYMYDRILQTPMITEKIIVLVNLQLIELNNQNQNQKNSDNANGDSNNGNRNGDIKIVLLVNNFPVMKFNTTTLSELLVIDFTKKTKIISISLVIYNNNSYKLCSCPSILKMGRFMSFWNGKYDKVLNNINSSSTILNENITIDDKKVNRDKYHSHVNRTFYTNRNNYIIGIKNKI